MCAFHAGRKLADFSIAGLTRSVASVALLSLAACSSTGQYSAENAAQPQKIAQGTVVEDDGLPPQAVPSMRLRDLPDEPSEPYSRNYGGINPSAEKSPLASAPADVQRTSPAVPHDLPPAFRKKLVAAINGDEYLLISPPHCAHVFEVSWNQPQTQRRIENFSSVVVSEWVSRAPTSISTRRHTCHVRLN